MDTKNQSPPDCAPLLLLPGLICDARVFAGQLARFPDATCAAYGNADTMGAMADRALAAAPARFALLGHSMGGRVALEIIRRAPDRVTALALICTGIHPPGAEEPAKRFALRDIGRNHGMAALVDAWLPPMVAPARRDDAAWLAPVRTMCIEAGLDRFEAQITALLARPAVAHLLPQINCPVLVATGSEDRWAPPEQHVGIAAAIPGASLEIISGAGHMLPAEAPDALNHAIAGWLTRG